MDLDARYEKLEKVGAGSFATVYRARDNELGREVAIKQIHAHYLEDPSQLERYWAEAQLLASLHHPNIVTIFDLHRDRGWLILELMQASLKDRLAGRQMDLKSLRTALAHTLRALKYLHAQGVVHGDIKPSNLMIDHRRRIKLGDFGLARRVSDEDGSVLKGTAKYMAPEMVSEEFGEVGPHSDLYSLGFTAYELMCGENFDDLFPGLNAFARDQQAAWVMWHAAADRRLPNIHRVLEGVPEDLAGVIQKLTEKDPARRYRTADEALADLHIDLKILRPGGNGDDDLSAEETTPPTNRKRLLLAAGALALSTVLSLVVLFMPDGSSTHTGPASTELGVVRMVDADRNLIEYEDPRTGIPAELVLGNRPRIFLLNEQQNILLRKLQPGDHIEIETAADDRGRKTVNLNVARPVSSVGIIEALDLAAPSLTLARTEGAVRDELVLQLLNRSKLRLNGKPAQVQELSVGDRIEVLHVLDPAGRRGHLISSLDAFRPVEVTGFVEHADPDRRTLLVSFGRGSAAASAEYVLADDCTIEREDDGTQITLQELQPGERLSMLIDNAIRRITVSRAASEITGTVAAVDVSGRMLVIKTDDGETQTFAVPEETELILNLQPAGLDDLRRQIDSVTLRFQNTADGSPAATSIDVHRGSMHDRWAVLIGMEAYNDRSVSALPLGVDDTQLVSDMLVNRYAFDRSRMTLLLDENLQEVRKGLSDALMSVTGQMQLIVYISAHAYLAKDGQVYIALKDYDWDQMEATGLPLSAVIQLVDESDAREKLLLLDLCHTGSGRDLERQPSVEDMLARECAFSIHGGHWQLFGRRTGTDRRQQTTRAICPRAGRSLCRKGRRQPGPAHHRRRADRLRSRRNGGRISRGSPSTARGGAAGMMRAPGTGRETLNAPTGRSATAPSGGNTRGTCGI